VAPPGSAGWGHTARSWLLDQAPPEYRSYPALTGQPHALTLLVQAHLEAGLAATRRSRGQVRVLLAEKLTPEAIGALLEVLDREEVRLLAAIRATALVAEALDRALPPAGRT
jgi:hypothetical protein